MGLGVGSSSSLGAIASGVFEMSSPTFSASDSGREAELDSMSSSLSLAETSLLGGGESILVMLLAVASLSSARASK